MRRHALAVLLFLWVTPVRAGIPADQEDCLGCHNDPTQAFDLPSGEKLPLFVDQEKFARSVHGEALRCTDCHSDKASDHASGKLPFKNRREATKAYFEACRGCHFANYTKTLDGVHFAVLSKGNDKVALCSDCHGAHDITKPTVPRTRISNHCEHCHQKEAGIYAQSVHGRASDVNADLPVCTDCHRAHDTSDPREGSLSRRTPILCGRCHGDAALMRKYRLSTSIMTSYLTDFHGMSTSLQRGHKQERGQRVAAVCTDCHGVHNIEKTDDPRSTAMSDNLQKTCAKCHSGANTTFPKAWLSHFQPSSEKAPLVWAVQLFYWMMIPFMVGGLVLQIALHLWRVVVNR
jgi:predicted CXXCH cytochrome family protein